MNQTTHTFNLISGIEAEVVKFKGRHQRALTERVKGESHTDRLNKLLVLTLVRVGKFIFSEVPEETRIDFVQNMTRADRRHALVEARQFTMDFEESFKFIWEYDNIKGQKSTYELEIPFTDKSFPITRSEKQYSSYDTLEREKLFTLPKSGEQVKYFIMDGKAETMLSKIAEDKISSHTPILARRPCFNNEGIWTPIDINDLDDMDIKDIEALRKEVLKGEGKVDTEIRFKHPEAEHKSEEKKYVVVDVLDSICFFFPSGMIS